MKTKAVEKSLNRITRKGETGYFVPETMFRKDNCIVIVNAGSDDQHDIDAIIKKGDKIHIYSAKTAKPASSVKQINLKPVRNSSSLFKSLSRSLSEVAKHRKAGTRPKTFEEFLDEL